MKLNAEPDGWFHTPENEYVTEAWGKFFDPEMTMEKWTPGTPALGIAKASNGFLLSDKRLKVTPENNYGMVDTFSTLEEAKKKGDEMIAAGTP